jgi:hypothetical protein
MSVHPTNYSTEANNILEYRSFRFKHWPCYPIRNQFSKKNLDDDLEIKNVGRIDEKYFVSRTTVQSWHSAEKVSIVEKLKFLKFGTVLDLNVNQ